MLIVGGGHHEIAVAENRGVNCPAPLALAAVWGYGTPVRACLIRIASFSVTRVLVPQGAENRPGGFNAKGQEGLAGSSFSAALPARSFMGSDY